MNLPELVNQLVSEHPCLERHAGRLLELARPALRMRPVAPTTGRVSESRMGGDPALPLDLAWPEHHGNQLDFLVQLDLARVPRGHLSLNLPECGWLCFFVDWENILDEHEGAEWFRVVYLDLADESRLVRCEFRGRSDLAPDGLQVPRACGIHFEPYFSVPSDPPDWWPEEEDDELYESTTAVLGFDDDEGEHHQLGGFPYAFQDAEALREACEKSPLHDEGDGEWLLLLQLDSQLDEDEPGPGWAFGDGGVLYFFIQERALERGDFSRVWLVNDTC